MYDVVQRLDAEAAISLTGRPGRFVEKANEVE
jgi:hypothetical protein